MKTDILAAANASLAEYGFSCGDFRLMNEKSQPTGVVLKYRKPRLYFFSDKGVKLFSCSPENAGEFLRTFWYREKIAK